MKKLILLIPLAAIIFFIVSLDPKTNKSSIDIKEIKNVVNDISLTKIKVFINDNWFTVTQTIEGFDISLKPKMQLSNDDDDGSILNDIQPDKHITLSNVPETIELQRIANKIAWNETLNKKENLIHWNTGESFASMGIGHFIWYPSGRSKEFSEQFPGMIKYLKGLGIKVPSVLLKQINKGSFWKTKSEWEADRNSKRYKIILEFLNNTKIQQAQFIQQKFMLDLLRLYSKSTPSDMTVMNKHIKKITNQPGGWYVLVDYTNFKGIGGNPHKRYQSYDWGLKTVLLNMKGGEPLYAFSNSAFQTLKTRVQKSPSNRTKQETKWLNGGWKKRVQEYKDPY